MAGLLFTEKDMARIRQEGLSPEIIQKQLSQLRRGIVPVRLDRPCTRGDGITDIVNTSLTDAYINAHDKAAQEGKIIKFIPASGAASRMFRDWFRCYEQGLDFDGTEKGADLMATLGLYAFYKDLQAVIARDNQILDELRRQGRYTEILGYVLTPKGLNYGYLPKALIPFHAYPEDNRTALEEQIVEALLQIKDVRNIVRLHVTVSPEHINKVEDFIARLREVYERKYHVTLELSLSIQAPETDTIAVDMNDVPLRDSRNSLVFRPGGHGALLPNLNALDSEIIFIKNIDNVVPDMMKSDVVFYKKILGGYLIKLHEETKEYLLKLANSKNADSEFVKSVMRFAREKLSMTFPASFPMLSLEAKCSFLFKKLNRPLRVCGMVKNEGEPGGGPFWITEADGTASLQIIEEAQIDKKSVQQRKIWESATHFNPVDIVCAVKDYRGNKFDLQEYVDQNTYLVSEKTMEGKNLKALELPGLWNGSMAFWNTVFVEVPAMTFNPVKTVSDLLRKEHACS